jgi:hypothetical protein
MISAKLVKLIEEHAEQLTQEFLKDIQTNPKTSSYHTTELMMFIKISAIG